MIYMDQSLNTFVDSSKVSGAYPNKVLLTRPKWVVYATLIFFQDITVIQG